MPDYDAIIKAVENDKPLPENVIDIPDVKESHTSYINCMQELNKHIAQLIELVYNAGKQLKSAEEMIRLAIKERDSLCDEGNETPKFKRVGDGNTYYRVGVTTKQAGQMNAVHNVDYHSVDDNSRFQNNNYFHTNERAQEVADKINFLLKLERLYDTFCPDYVPDWNDWRTKKWEIDYENSQGRYRALSTPSTESKTAVYFPTEDIAQKVCDILNAERD